MLLVPLAEDESFTLARDPATIGVKEILDSVRGVANGKLQGKRDKDERLIDEILLDVDHAAARSLQGKTLQDAVLALEPQQRQSRPNDSETVA